MAVVDLNQEVGRDCQVQLDAAYGEGNSMFIQCDITDGDKLKGIGLCYSYFITLPICIWFGAFCAALMCICKWIVVRIYLSRMNVTVWLER